MLVIFCVMNSIIYYILLCFAACTHAVPLWMNHELDSIAKFVPTKYTLILNHTFVNSVKFSESCGETEEWANGVSSVNWTNKLRREMAISIPQKCAR